MKDERIYNNYRAHDIENAIVDSYGNTFAEFRNSMDRDFALDRINSHAYLLTACRIAYDVMTKRLYAWDKNPLGIIDLLGLAISKGEENS